MATDSFNPRASSTPSSPGAPAENLAQLVTFRIGREAYGVDIMSVKEIILCGHVTEVPNVPAHLSGLINLRGHVIPVIDLRKRLGMAAGESSEDTRIIIMNTGRRTVGMIVDAVDEVLRINRKQVQAPPPPVGQARANFISGLVNVGNNRLTLIVSLRELIESECGDSAGAA